MSIYYLRNIPEYYLNRFSSVRSSFDNFLNLLNLAEIVNTCHECYVKNSNQFDIAIFTGGLNRAVIKKNDGYFSMSIPFQIINSNDHITFISNYMEEEVSGIFISIMRNTLQTMKSNSASHEDVILSLIENFNIELQDSIKYYDAFVSILSEDHGYFRFDNDPENENGDIHPRFHFDIFYKDSTALKIGYDRDARLECFQSLFDSTKEKKYLTNSSVLNKQ